MYLSFLRCPYKHTRHPPKVPIITTWNHTSFTHGIKDIEESGSNKDNLDLMSWLRSTSYFKRQLTKSLNILVFEGQTRQILMDHRKVNQEFLLFFFFLSQILLLQCKVIAGKIEKNNSQHMLASNKATFPSRKGGKGKVIIQSSSSINPE